MRTIATLSAVAALSGVLFGAQLGHSENNRTLELVEAVLTREIRGLGTVQDHVFVGGRTEGQEVVRGFLRARRHILTTGERIMMEGSLQPMEAVDLLEAAQGSVLVDGVADPQNQVIDFLTVNLTARNPAGNGIYGRTRRTVPAPDSAPVLERLERAVNTLANATLFVYEESGGLLGTERRIVITNSGWVTDEISDPAPPGVLAAPGVYAGQANASDVMELRDLCQGWRAYPESFGSDPSQTDGLAITTTYYFWGQPDTVFAGWPHDRPPSYQAILDHVRDDLAGSIHFGSNLPVEPN